MGATKSAPLTFKKSAPLGDPLEVVLRGYALSLRRKEGDLVDVEVSAKADKSAKEEVGK